MIANYHTHTWRCHHARDTEEEYVRSAVQAGLEILGFSDHSPYLFPGDYYSTFRMDPEQLEDYCSTVLTLRDRYRGQIEIPLGLELEYYPAFLPRLLPVLQDAGIEYLLLGQHFVGNEIGSHYSGRSTSDEDVLRQYCYQTADALNTGLFTYFAHPDLLFYTGDEKTYRQNMRLICREARNCDIPLEVNLLGIREGRNYPNPLFWETAAEEGCRVILGCDAHAAQHLLEKEAEPAARKLIAHYGLELIEKLPLKHI